jgi:hypothetical protein
LNFKAEQLILNFKAEQLILNVENLLVKRVETLDYNFVF